MYVWPGVFAIWSALVAGLASAVTYWRVDRGRRDLLPFARTTYLAFTVSVVTSAAILMTLLLQHRFDVAYVNSYSARDLPTHFLISTFWAGQEGSFLLWCFWGSLIGLFVWRSAKEQEAPVMVVYLATFLGIIAILCKQSPFKLLPPPAPADGVGLNPLLQDPWMVIHPPIMFLGFASLSVPFSFAIAALWKKRWDGWITRALPWALLTFVTLGTAILMGGYWAYKTLGWGGYWGWDPVENTSLVPWLFTAALVHGMFLQRTRKRHRKINLVLACTAFAAILYGTFLTRSGVLADFSVHSFIDLGITGWLVGILGTLHRGCRSGCSPGGGARFRSSQDEEPPLLSRSVFFILGIAVFCALAAVILLGTSAPILTRLSGTPSQVQTSFYAKTTTPAGFLLILLAGLVPFVGWKGETGRGLWKSSRRSLAVAAVITLVALGFGARQPRSLDPPLHGLLRGGHEPARGAAQGLQRQARRRGRIPRPRGRGHHARRDRRVGRLRQIAARDAADQRSQKSRRRDADVPARGPRGRRPQDRHGGPRRDGRRQGVLRVPEDVREQQDRPAHGQPLDPELRADGPLHRAAAVRPRPARGRRARRAPP